MGVLKDVNDFTKILKKYLETEKSDDARKLLRHLQESGPNSCNFTSCNMQYVNSFDVNLTKENIPHFCMADTNTGNMIFLTRDKDCKRVGYIKEQICKNKNIVEGYIAFNKYDDIHLQKRNGQKYCVSKKLADIESYKHIKDSIIFKVTANTKNDFDMNDGTYMCTKIFLERGLSSCEIKEYAENLYKNQKNFSLNEGCFLASFGIGLDEFIKSDDWEIRSCVAEFGRPKDLDVLVYDNDENVRQMVALQGRDKDLDILIDDAEWCVRSAVAKQGREKDLLRLLDNEEKETAVLVSCALTGTKKILDRLMKNNPCREVKQAILQNKNKEEYIPTLLHDTDEYVRAMVAKIGKEKELRVLAHDESPIVREQVAKRNISKYLDLLENDKNIRVRDIVKKLKYKEDISTDVKNFSEKEIDNKVRKQVKMRESDYCY